MISFVVARWLYGDSDGGGWVYLYVCVRVLLGMYERVTVRVRE